MTAPAPQCQPIPEPVRQERMWCLACGTVTNDGICDCNNYGKTDCEPNFVNYADAMQEEAHALAQENATLKSRAEQAERAVDVLESNARQQAKLLADTGRRVEALEAALREARRFIDPDGDPTALTAAAMRARICAALPKQEPGE